MVIVRGLFCSPSTDEQKKTGPVIIREPDLPLFLIVKAWFPPRGQMNNHSKGLVKQYSFFLFLFDSAKVRAVLTRIIINIKLMLINFESASAEGINFPNPKNKRPAP